MIALFNVAIVSIAVIGLIIVGLVKLVRRLREYGLSFREWMRHPAVIWLLTMGTLLLVGSSDFVQERLPKKRGGPSYSHSYGYGDEGGCGYP